MQSRRRYAIRARPRFESGTNKRCGLRCRCCRRSSVCRKSRAEAIAALRPGVDGVLLRYHGRRGTFLPQVWDELPERHEFYRHLLRKAGLPPELDSAELEVYRYTVDKWKQEPQR